MPKSKNLGFGNDMFDQKSKEEIKIEKENVIYVFIDASNLWEALKVMGRFLNFEKTIKYIKEKFNGTNINHFIIQRIQ